METSLQYNRHSTEWWKRNSCYCFGCHHRSPRAPPPSAPQHELNAPTDNWQTHSIATVDEAACSSKEYAGEIKLDGGTSAEVCSGWITSRRFNVTQPTQPTCPPVAHPRCPRPRPLATPRPFGMRVASAAGGSHSAAGEPPRYPRVPGGVLLVVGWFPGRFWAL